MPRLAWSAVGQRLYEIGVDQGVLYIGEVGYAWNGLVSVDETPSGGEARPYYIDGKKYLNLAAKEEFEATISAFYSPPQFDVCDGLGLLQPGLSVAQQRRQSFGLSYRTKVGNDVDSVEHGYKIHIVYNALAAPSGRSYSTINDNPEAPLLRWAITTKPSTIAGASPSAHLIIDSTTAPASSLADLEDLLYGSDINPPTLPTPAEVIAMFTDATVFEVTDLGGGETFSIVGPGSAVVEIDADTYEITYATVIPVDGDSSEISS
jgi:hypothetical protein